MNSSSRIQKKTKKYNAEMMISFNMALIGKPRDVNGPVAILRESTKQMTRFPPSKRFNFELGCGGLSADRKLQLDSITFSLLDFIFCYMLHQTTTSRENLERELLSATRSSLKCRQKYAIDSQHAHGGCLSEPALAIRN